MPEEKGEFQNPKQEEQEPQTPEIQPELQNGALIREVLQPQINRAQELEESTSLYEKEAYERADKIVEEVETYVDRQILNRDEAKAIYKALLADRELNGLIDPKTGLLNEPGFDRRLAAMISHAKRNNESIALAYIDMIGFKPINDTLGHEVGDKVFEYFRDYMTQMVQIRDEDVFSRLHGDEFTIAFPQGRIESISQKFAGEVLGGQMSSYIRQRMQADGIESRDVAARVGLVEMQGNDTVATFKKRADDAMNAQRENEPQQDSR